MPFSAAQLRGAARDRRDLDADAIRGDRADGAADLAVVEEDRLADAHADEDLRQRTGHEGRLQHRPSSSCTASRPGVSPRTTSSMSPGRSAIHCSTAAQRADRALARTALPCAAATGACPARRTRSCRSRTGTSPRRPRRRAARVCARGCRRARGVAGLRLARAGRPRRESSRRRRRLRARARRTARARARSRAERVAPRPPLRDRRPGRDRARCAAWVRRGRTTRAQRLPVSRSARRRCLTIAFPHLGDVVRAVDAHRRSMPPSTRSRISAGSSAASPGIVTMIRVAPAAARGPRIASACCGEQRVAGVERDRRRPRAMSAGTGWSRSVQSTSSTACSEAITCASMPPERAQAQPRELVLQLAHVVPAHGEVVDEVAQALAAHRRGAGRAAAANSCSAASAARRSSSTARSVLEAATSRRMSWEVTRALAGSGRRSGRGKADFRCSAATMMRYRDDVCVTVLRFDAVERWRAL